MTLDAIYAFAKPAWIIMMVLIFTGIVLWAFMPSNKKRFEEDADILFKDKRNGA